MNIIISSKKDPIIREKKVHELIKKGKENEIIEGYLIRCEQGLECEEFIIEIMDKFKKDFIDEKDIIFKKDLIKIYEYLYGDNFDINKYKKAIKYKSKKIFNYILNV